MTITTNLSGRVKNTQLAYRRGLMPLFEAVQNSIHAIEDGPAAIDGQIVVEIVRDQQRMILDEGATNKRGPPSQADITGFRVKDNGVGFTDQHMKSFETLDTDLKEAIGGRGVGRLLWLKAFSRASLDSVYVDANGNTTRRRFKFTREDGVSDVVPVDVSPGTNTGTLVCLEEFHQKYRDASLKTIDAIASSLFEHCLWYFVRKGGAPHIRIVDGERNIDLHDVYEKHMHSSASTDTFSLKESTFQLIHMELRSTVSKNHFIGWCASNRLVDEESITGKVPGLYGFLGDEDDAFLYACYVTSPYLDERVRPERTGFIMEETRSDGLFSRTEISKDEATDAVMERVANYLSSYLQSSRQAGLRRVHDFVAQEKPQYRPIVARIPEDKLYVDPKITNKDLDVLLHQHKSESEGELLSRGHDVMEPRSSESIEDYTNRVAEYLRLAEALKRSDLAEYVLHRKVILDLLGVAIERSEDGTYPREKLIHDLIMPMQRDSMSTEFERNNLWLIDERLTFHDFLASDKQLRSIPITDSNERRRPDLVALNVFDESILLTERKELPLASIVVVEMKRPMRNDAGPGRDRNPIEQTIGYLKRIREGEMRTTAGRQIPNSPDVPGFCYVVCDLTETMKQRCELAGLQATSDYMGYFGYNPANRAYVEVISFDRLLRGAKERNRVFFDKLGLPAN